MTCFIQIHNARLLLLLLDFGVISSQLSLKIGCSRQGQKKVVGDLKRNDKSIKSDLNLSYILFC